MSSNTFNWAILGPGRIAQRFAGGLTAIEDANLYAVASRDMQRAQTFATQFNADHAFDSYESLLEDDNVDGIYIATPHNLHFEQAKMCLKAQKPILCEKPLTVNAQQTKELIGLSRENNTFLMEALWTRYLPIYDVVKNWINEGAIGEVQNLNSTMGFNFPKNYEDRIYKHELAGGGLLDLGVYIVNISQWVFGANPIDFRADAVIGNTQVDEQITVALHYDKYKTSQFTVSITALQSNEFLIHGTQGFIRIHSMFWDTMKATMSNFETETTITRQFDATGFEYETREAMKCIREGKIESPNMTHQDTFANMSVMDAIRAEIDLKYNFE